MGSKTSDMGIEGFRRDRFSRLRNAGLLYNGYTPYRSAHDG